MKEGRLVKIFNITDARLKFPNLRKGETGIQVGFDLSSRSLTTDVLKMFYRTTNEGLIVAVDPDPYNHEVLKPVIEKRGLNVLLVQKGTYSKKTTDKLSPDIRWLLHNKYKQGAQNQFGSP